MAIEYFKNQKSGNRVSYHAVGNEVEDESGIKSRPYATIDVGHNPKEWIVPYKNDEEPEPHTGLSHDYLNHVTDSLESIGDEKWTGIDDEAVDTIYSIPFRSHSQEEKDDYAAKIATNSHFHPQKLFYEGKPSSMSIDYMVSDPSMSHTALTLGALAKRDLKAEHIIASDDLSPWSSHLTRNAIKRGLPVAASEYNSTAAVTNDMDKHPLTITVDQYNSQSDRSTPVPKGTVSAARQDLRQMLRNPVPPISISPPQNLRDLDIEQTQYRKPPARKMQPKRNTQPVTKKGLSDQFLPGMKGFV